MLYSLAIDLLPTFVNSADLSSLLMIFPGVVRARVIRNAEGRSIGTAIVDVKSTRTVEKIVAALDGEVIQGYPIRISRL